MRPGRCWLALTALWLCACNAGEALQVLVAPIDVLRLPFDLAHQRKAMTQLAAPGPTEAALYRYALQSGPQELLGDAADPRLDWKRIARRCDGGERSACEQVAEVFVFWFRDEPFGVQVWERACGRGDLQRCTQLGHVYETAHLLGPEDRERILKRNWDCAATPGEPLCIRLAALRERARIHHLAACLAPQAAPQACRFAGLFHGTGYRSSAPITLNATRWSCWDRACLLGDATSCFELAWKVSQRDDLSSVPDADAYYATRGRRLEGIAPRPADREGAELRTRIEDVLLASRDSAALCITPQVRQGRTPSGPAIEPEPAPLPQPAPLERDPRRPTRRSY